MHANKREEIASRRRRRRSSPSMGLKDTTTGDTLCDPTAPGRPRVDDLPGPGHRGRDRAQDQGRPGEARHRDPEARRGGPDLPGPDRRGDRPDDHRRHGRAPPRDPGRPDAARVQASRPTSASRRSPTARRSAGPSRSTTTPTRSRPVGPASSPRCMITLEPLDDRATAPATSSSTTSPVVASRASTSRRSTTACQDAMEFGVLAGYPMVDVKVDPRGRRLPRRRLLRDGVQDRRLDGVQGGRPEGRAGAARADDGRRGDHARGLHGRRHRRHQLAAAGRSSPWRSVSGARVVKALVPLSEMFGYVGDLRSKTQGRASYSMEFDSLRRGPAGRRRGDHQEGPRRVSSPRTPVRPQQSHRPVRPTLGIAPAPNDVTATTVLGGDHSGEGEVRADQAARQHRHHRSHRPRQDDADRGDHQGAARQVPGPEPASRRSTRSTRRPRSGSAVSPSRSRTSSTRPRSATTRTSTAPVTPTTSRT